ncbi:hypothetical protein BDN67DRAFT_832464 [Paxillus ammoniavirescens]|nr:hypothetical protein BDN67DRAFT_832464 [Paxillus ammoniavirescens]
MEDGSSRSRSVVPKLYPISSDVRGPTGELLISPNRHNVSPSHPHITGVVRCNSPLDNFCALEEYLCFSLRRIFPPNRLLKALLGQAVRYGDYDPYPRDVGKIQEYPCQLKGTFSFWFA